MLDAVFVTVLLISINSILRPLARLIDQRSLAVMDTHTLYRLRLSCDSEHQTEAEHRVAHAIAVSSLVLREVRAEKVEGADTSLVQAIFESATHDPNLLNALAAGLRDYPWTQSVEWTEAGNEAE
jgi:putative Mg2+ transporter-C (MgtC) family protein